jgi:hypothetical protein
MTQVPASRRALRYALGMTSQHQATRPATDGYSVARRTLAALLGVRLPDRSRSAGYTLDSMDGDTSPLRIARRGVPERTAPGPLGAAPPQGSWLGADPRLSGALRLPRFDRAALRTAGTASAQRLSREMSAAGVRYVLSDAGRDRLEILAETASPASSVMLPVTVVTPDRRTDYLLLFQAQESGTWAAALHVPGFWYWADVLIHEAREVESLDSHDAEVVRRSVRAVPDPWVPGWQSVALGRAAGDPVRDAIEEALRS